MTVLAFEDFTPGRVFEMGTTVVDRDEIIELLDTDTQFIAGDANPFAAGRRVAATVRCALAQKFRPASENLVPREKLFSPQLVGAAHAGGAAAS